ncbi:MAG: LexA family transcriptional regulator [Cytophagaceae bacterium]|nr:LexA family transcriptional regulator [Cytophagaceae bacterium]
MRNTIANLELFRVDPDTTEVVPLLGLPIMAGFPSPADDFVEAVLDLNKELVRFPESTFLGRVKGDSLRDLDIEAGDVLVVDKLLRPDLSAVRETLQKKPGYRRKPQLIVCWLDGGFTVKMVKLFPTRCLLYSANEAYPPIIVTAENEFILWGVVTYVIKKTY